MPLYKRKDSPYWWIKIELNGRSISKIQKGTQLHALKELGGWESQEMVQRYAHLSPGHLAQYVSSMTDKKH